MLSFRKEPEKKSVSSDHVKLWSNWSATQRHGLMICCIPLDFSAVAVQISGDLSDMFRLHFKIGRYIFCCQNNLRSQTEWKRSFKQTQYEVSVQSKSNEALYVP